jgi:antitoxin component of RelBE/YafQ-DinJ toxin-antitoxin module
MSNSQKRLSAYVDSKTHKEFTDALRKEGLTFSGWLRKMIREFLDRVKAKSK